MRLILIDGQGNFGSVDGDPPAAMRYTEIAAGASGDVASRRYRQRHGRFSIRTMTATKKSRRSLPARFPNLLANGAGGIAVGMATNIPPHNLGELIDACVAMIDDPAITIDDLNAIMPGPDFPTGGVILGRWRHP